MYVYARNCGQTWPSKLGISPPIKAKIWEKALLAVGGTLENNKTYSPKHTIHIRASIKRRKKRFSAPRLVAKIFNFEYGVHFCLLPASLELINSNICCDIALQWLFICVQCDWILVEKVKRRERRKVKVLTVRFLVDFVRRHKGRERECG